MGDSAFSLRKLEERLHNFFSTAAIKLEEQPGGASSRKFFKISFESTTYFNSDTVMLMYVPIQDAQALEDYVAMDYYFLRNDILTPRLYEVVAAEGWVFTEFISYPTLELHLKKFPDQIETAMDKAVEFLERMQTRCKPERGAPAFTRSFDYDKYKFEFDFHFAEQLLKHYHEMVPHAESLERFSDKLGRELDMNWPVLVHRDFQSSNILLTSSDLSGDLAIVDFQDARSGTPIYDLVSCLWDSYIPVSEEQRQGIVDRFWHTPSVQAMGLEKSAYVRLIDLTAAQRKLHDAGAFAYNYRRFGSDRYVGYIESAVTMAYDRLKLYSEYRDGVQILEHILKI